MINVAFDLADSATVIIPLDRWGNPRFRIQVDTGDIDIQGTLQRVNRGETPVWNDLDDWEGNSMIGLTGPMQVVLNTGPLEAVLITANAISTGRLMQSGPR